MNRIPANCDGLVVHSGDAGLCNRVLALAAFAAVAEKLKCPLYAFWSMNDHCYGFPEQCFDRKSMYWTPITEDKFVELCRSLKAPGIFPYWMTSAPVRKFAGWAGLGLEDVWLRVARFVRQLQPSGAVSQKLQVLGDLGWRTGIHVRRTDLYGGGKATNSQRDESLRNYLDNVPYTAVTGEWLVAADNAESLIGLQSLYGDKIVATGASFCSDRLRKTTLIDSALDLFALASCKRILGTDGSTFGTTASLLRGAKLEML